MKEQFGLRYKDYKLKVQFINEVDFKDFNASAWRGILGQSLRKTACSTGAKTCDQCMMSAHCAYHIIFETSPGVNASRMTKYNAVPHPFVIKNQSKIKVKDGEFYELQFMLVGMANEYLPYMLNAFIQAEKQGVTNKKSQFKVKELCSKNEGKWAPIWTDKNKELKKESLLVQTAETISKKYKTIRIKFITPLKIISQGRQLLPQDFQIVHLIRSLTRRISMLAYFHEDRDITVDFKKIHEEAETVKLINKQLQQVTWKRYSNRQKKKMEIQGIIGEVEINIEDLNELWPILWMGEQIHAGKLTSMGLGQYEIELKQ